MEDIINLDEHSEFHGYNVRYHTNFNPPMLYYKGYYKHGKRHGFLFRQRHTDPAIIGFFKENVALGFQFRFEPWI